MKSKATLRVIGDDLVPDEVTRLLGCGPTRGYPKGAVIDGKSGRERISHTGSWHLEAAVRDPEDLDGQITEILDRLNPHPDIWASLSGKFRVDLFCGLFMARRNEGISLSPAVLAALGSRCIELSLDVHERDSRTDNIGA
jgi:hypothetical protein